MLTKLFTTFKNQSVKIISFVGVYVLLFPVLVLALPNPEFTFDLSRFNKVKTNLIQLQDLRVELTNQYLDLYFGQYGREKNIDVAYTPLPYLKKRVKERIENEKSVQKLVFTSVGQGLATFKRIADEAVVDFERSGRLTIGQKQTANDATLKALAEKIDKKIAADTSLRKELSIKFAKAQEEAKKANTERLANSPVERQTLNLISGLKKGENILYIIGGIAILNLLFTVYIYKETL